MYKDGYNYANIISSELFIKTHIYFAGNQNVTFFELDSVMGHDTFLLDLTSIGHAVKGFLENDLNIS